MLCCVSHGLTAITTTPCPAAPAGTSTTSRPGGLLVSFRVVRPPQDVVGALFAKNAKSELSAISVVLVPRVASEELKLLVSRDD